MPDITMCKDHTCPLSLKCYRFTAKPNPEWQSYFTDIVRNDNICDYFINNSIYNTKVFIRTEHEDGKIECSWYDKNGRRYKHELSNFKWNGKSPRETDNTEGYYSYAKTHDFYIIDDYKEEHPKRFKR